MATIDNALLQKPYSELTEEELEEVIEYKATVKAEQDTLKQLLENQTKAEAEQVAALKEYSDKLSNQFDTYCKAIIEAYENREEAVTPAKAEESEV